jgi:phosphate transport system permease protein
MAVDGVPRLTPSSSPTSRRAARPGRHPVGLGRSILVMLVTALWPFRWASPPAIYLEEYAPQELVTDIIEINITNLAGVPSIIYGLLALGLFVYTFGLGQSILPPA